MPKLLVEHVDPAPLYPVLPPDTIVQVTVVSSEIKQATNSKTGESWDKIEFKFKIESVPTSLESTMGNAVGSHIWGSVSYKLSDHPDNKLKQWSEALLGFELGQGYELDTDDLVGRKARAVISNYTKRNGEAQHQVTALLPSVSTTLRSATSAPSVQAESLVPGGANAAPMDSSMFSTDGSDDPPFF